MKKKKKRVILGYYSESENEKSRFFRETFCKLIPKFGKNYFVEHFNLCSIQIIIFMSVTPIPALYRFYEIETVAF